MYTFLNLCKHYSICKAALLILVVVNIYIIIIYFCMCCTVYIYKYFEKIAVIINFLKLYVNL